MWGVVLSCDCNRAKTSSLISMWQCRRQKRHIPERLFWAQRTARSSRARWSEFLQLLIKWKVKFQPSWLEGAAAVCVAVEVLSVINFMKRGASDGWLGFWLISVTDPTTVICLLTRKSTREKRAMLRYLSMEMEIIATCYSFLNSTV